MTWFYFVATPLLVFIFMLNVYQQGQFKGRERAADLDVLRVKMIDAQERELQALRETVQLLRVNR